ncbi:hypothetical protein KAJ87_01310 [Candidatus Pacearchaeota archaeon]|nr:hypothetical protein [Candidatus Pacearchaeota archaeon]
MEGDRELFRKSLDKIRNEIKRTNSPTSLEDLAEKIKREVNVNNQVEGTISCEFGDYVPGRGVLVSRTYDFLKCVIREVVGPYDNKSQAENEALEDGFNNFVYFMKPYSVTSFGNKVLVETPKRNLSNESQLSLFD